MTLDEEKIFLLEKSKEYQGLIDTNHKAMKCLEEEKDHLHEQLAKYQDALYHNSRLQNDSKK